MRITDKEISRQLYHDLRMKGFTPEQASFILSWTESLPVHITGTCINIRIEQGIISISPFGKLKNKEDEEENNN